jgi:SAM-dependent methyltransferase
MEQYQDIWIKGKTKQGVRECESRYKAIRAEIKKSNFTLLDIGANLGYFGIRLASEFPDSVVVLIESDYGQPLKDIAEANALPNLIVLNTRLDSEKIQRLADCEFFDYVLCLNVLHHIGSDAIEAVKALGEVVIVETPHPADTGSCGQEHLAPIFVWAKELEEIGRFSRHTSNVPSLMGVYRNKKTGLRRKFWDADERGMLGLEQITIKKGVYRNNRTEGEECRAWKAGINYRTFQHLNGIYPDNATVHRAISRLDAENHTDFAPWNIIIRGAKMETIDKADSRYTTRNGEQTKRFMLETVGKKPVPNIQEY